LVPTTSDPSIEEQHVGRVVNMSRKKAATSIASGEKFIQVTPYIFLQEHATKILYKK
jgi:hypothetical protein